MEEARSATEELRACTRELEGLLEAVLLSRSDLRIPSLEEIEPNVADAHGQDAEVIRESMRLRRRSQKVRTAMHRPHAGPGLSKRERQVLSLMVDGKSSKEIAADLGISFKTAVTHRASIMSKLDVHETASVVREAIRRGLV